MPLNRETKPNQSIKYSRFIFTKNDETDYKNLIDRQIDRQITRERGSGISVLAAGHDDDDDDDFIEKS